MIATKWSRVAGGLFALGLHAVPSGAQNRHEFTAVHMGVQVRIVLYAPTDSQAQRAARAAFARIAELDEKMSDYRPESEVRLLSRQPGIRQSVSPELRDVLVIAREVSRHSAGAFDVTLGPLTQLWRASRRAGRLPEASALADARSRAGPALLEVDSAASTVRLRARGMLLDLGGIAKGYILQDALRVLRDHGMPSAMVEAGGDIVVGDAPPGRTGWSVRVESADSAIVERAGALANAAVATSGGSIQYVEINGIRYSHVVDPRTGLGMKALHVVTVIGDNAALTDAAATALSVLGPTRSNSFRARYPALLVAFTDPGR